MSDEEIEFDIFSITPTFICKSAGKKTKKFNRENEFNIFSKNYIFNYKYPVDTIKNKKKFKSQSIYSTGCSSQEFECWICKGELYLFTPKEIYLKEFHLRQSVWKMTCCKKYVHGACFYRLSQSRYSAKICPFCGKDFDYDAIKIKYLSEKAKRKSRDVKPLSWKLIVPRRYRDADSV